MPCPTCYFPGNAPGATQCAQCGSPLTPPGGGYPAAPVAYDVHPVSGQGAMPAAPPPYQPLAGPPLPPPPAPGAGPYAQYPTGGYAQVPPVSGVPYPGMPMSPTPISITPSSGAPSSGAPGPGYYQPLKPSRSRVLLPLTVIVVVLVIASTVIAVVKLKGSSDNTAGPAPTTTGTPSDGPTSATPRPPTPTTAAPTKTPDPVAQAAAVDALLNASVSSRKKLNDAIQLVGDCTLVEKAIADMQAAGAEREAQIDNIGKFDLSAIPEGEQVRAALKEALGFSLAADRNFVQWAQAQQSSGCSGGGQSYYDEAQRQSTNATNAKNRFLGVWNPVASRYQLQPRSSDNI
ncbi:hypothetical protein Dvina_47110 [Dactylosporangium vinaceum]|uniref:Zinc ribbon domain-containing protein n=1 Tax=Dactylosporangium vinaceum TaxID=53362 RepID=A0ABV5M5D1_9ACTN|nr:hypothetical protein [Dactylosporangium vinaceum]UAB95508.1 hypothetical protein Dvina_47110 [Dactylosporangium vinaceum]